jgi:hypothetical protein
MRLALASLLALTAIAAAPDASAGSVAPQGASSPTWMLDHPYVIAGTGCTKDVDAFASTNGGDLSIVFSAFAFAAPSLSAPPPAGAVDTKSCLVRVAATIPTGVWPTRLAQTVGAEGYDDEKTHDTFSTRALLFGFTATPFLTPLTSDVLDPSWSKTHEDRFERGSSWQASWCQPRRPTIGLFQGQLSLSAPRGHDDGVLYHETDLRYDIEVELHPC